MSVITLYRIPQVIELTTGTGAMLMNYAVNRTDITLYRNVDNEIDIMVKNIDRKPIAFANCSATIHILDSRNERLLMSRDLDVVDEDEGHLRFAVSGDEAAALPKKSLSFSVVMTKADNSTTMLFTDRHRQASGVVHVTDGPLPDPIAPIEVLWDEFLPRNNAFYAGSYKGAAMVSNESGLHSVVVYLDNFSGTFSVEGSLELTATQADDDWFEVATETFVTETGAVHISFEGNLMWVRFKVVPGAGAFTSLIYRN